MAPRHDSHLCYVVVVVVVVVVVIHEGEQGTSNLLLLCDGVIVVFHLRCSDVAFLV